MMKNIFIIGMLILASHLSEGQNDLRILGQVSTPSGEPIYNAHIYIKNTSFGTTSNEDGDFSLKLSKEYTNDTLVISSIGYHSVFLPIKDATPQRQLIKLEEDISLLNEIVISSLSAKEIVGKMRDNISKNYPKGYNVYDLHFKEIIKNDDQFSRYMEIAAEMTTVGFNKKILTLKDFKEMKIKGKRISQTFDNRPIDKGIGFNGIYNGFKVYDLRLDISDLYFDKYIFELEGMTTYEGFSAYKISIQVPRLYAKNIVLITTDSYALVSSRYEQDYINNPIEQREGLTGDPYFVKVILEADFHEIEGLWYLSYIRDYRLKDYKGDSSQSMDSQIRVLNVRKNENLKDAIKMDQLIDLYQHPCPFDPEFWKNYNAPQASEFEERIRAEMDKNNVKFVEGD